MATKISSKAVTLQLSIATVYTDIPCLDSINAPDCQPQTTDTTCLDSGVGMEKKPTGYADGGVVNATGFLDPLNTVHQALTDLLTAPAVAGWKIKWSDASTTLWPFSGTLSSLSATAKVGEFVKFALGITLDGMVTYPT